MNIVSEVKPLAKFSNSSIIAGLLTVILGVLVLAWPGASIAVAAILFGAYLLVSGIAQVVGAFGLPVSSPGGRVLMFISGAASLILAVLCLRDFSESVLLLSVWIGIGFVFRGIAAIAMAFGDVPTAGRGWVVLSGVITVIAGFVMLAYPISSLQVLALVAGAWLVVLGAIETVAAIQLRKQVA